MKKILPLLMLLIGTGAGVGAGVFLRSGQTPEETEAAKAEVEEKTEEETELSEGEKTEDLPIDGKEYVKLSNQFVVPIVETDRISSMVVMTLSIEAPTGEGQLVFDIEPKIRDVFLRVLFDHAAIGGFQGAFLNNENLDAIRSNLRDAAHKNFGSEFISDVLIFEIARQDY
ncbi:MAG: flagellar basal body-associated FliL family protein [Roseobacter sp.]